MFPNILRIFIVLFISLLNINELRSFTTRAPLWVTHNKFRAGNLIVINNNINSPSINTFTHTFTSNLSGTPRIAYGFKCHKGKLFIYFNY
jgi:hypothetical protein